MEIENLLYSLVQIAHNFGAAAVVGGPCAALWMAPAPHVHHRLAWLVLLGWALQAFSGIGFGAVSYYVYGEFPEINGIAIGALILKIACAALGMLFTLVLLINRRAQNWPRPFWFSLTLFGIAALTAAAVLRWFS